MKRIIPLLSILLILTACTAPAATPTSAPVVAVATGVPFNGIPQSVDKDGFYTLGSPSAPVTLIDYADFLCTNCHVHFETTEPELIQKYIKTGKVQMTVRYVLSFGERSVRTAEASACASLQGWGWQMHDLLFQNQAEVWATPEDQMIPLMKKYGALLKGLDQAKFGTCIETRQMQKIVEAGDAEQRTRGITTRPIFEIKGQRMIGVQSIEAFDKFIGAALVATP